METSNKQSIFDMQ